jgi:hypothetical protein
VEDHRPQTAGGDDQNRGTMFATWKDRLLYDEGAHQILIAGNANVGFQQDAKNAAPMLLTSDAVTVDLVPTKSATTKPAAAGAPPGDPTAAMGKMQMSHARAVGHVEFRVKGKDIRFHAHQADYDPSADRLIASGSAEDPAFFEDEQGTMRNNFDMLVFDTRKQEVDHVTGMHGTMQK